MLDVDPDPPQTLPTVYLQPDVPDDSDEVPNHVSRLYQLEPPKQRPTFAVLGLELGCAVPE